MEGLIKIRGQKGIRVLYLDSQGDIYISCDDLERVAGGSYISWLGLNYGAACIGYAEGIYPGDCLSHYDGPSGHYEGLWLRMDMAVIYIRFYVYNLVLLRQVESGILEFLDCLNEVKGLSRGLKSFCSLDGIIECPVDLPDIDGEIMSTLYSSLPEVGMLLHIRDFRENMCGDYASRKIYSVISRSSDFVVIRRPDGRYIKRINNSE